MCNSGIGIDIDITDEIKKDAFEDTNDPIEQENEHLINTANPSTIFLDLEENKKDSFRLHSYQKVLDILTVGDDCGVHFTIQGIHPLGARNEVLLDTNDNKSTNTKFLVV